MGKTYKRSAETEYDKKRSKKNIKNTKSGKSFTPSRKEEEYMRNTYFEY